MAWELKMTISIVAVLSVAVGILAAVSTERVFMEECTVVVLDANGLPVKGIRVTESWDSYSYELHGGGDIFSDEQGRVTFPKGAARHSLLFWQLRPVLTQLNYGVHASFGTSAFVHISQSGVVSDDGFSCSNNHCNDHRLVLQFRITRQ